MTLSQRKRSAAACFIGTSVLWLHEWVPALLVGAFVLWVISHTRLGSDLGEALFLRWRRAWPPTTFVLVPLLVAGTLAYVFASVPTSAKLLPVAVNLLALSVLGFGDWWRLFRAPSR